MRKQHGFTLIELLIVIGVIAVMTTILIPVVGDIMEQTRVAKCMANMKHISGAIANKMSENIGNRIFGVLDFTCDPAELLPNRDLPADINVATADDLSDTGLAVTANTNAMQNVWQMVADYEVTPRAFLCASDSATTERPPAAARYGWTALTEFSYGIQFPYGTYGIDEALKERAVIMADRSPGGPVNGSSIKHSNHNDGVVVLYYDGNADFHEADDSLAGYGGDDIYINTTATPGGEPTGTGDTSITPVPSRAP